MPTLISNTFRHFSRKTEHGLKTLYVALAIFSIHWSLVTYINSSFLDRFISPSEVNMLYVVASVLSLGLFFYMPLLLKTFGNYRLTMLFSIIELAALLGMALSESAASASFFFILHFSTAPLILFTIDIFVEAMIGTREQQTGSMRGLYLGLLSLSAAIAPLITGLLVYDDTSSFTLVYVASALFLTPFMGVIMLYFKEFKDDSYSLLHLHKMFYIFISERMTRNIFFVQLFLQLFFLWTILYIPLYLSREMNFTWEQIGYIIFAGLSAYVIFEYPVGIIADKYIGEKEMMAFGFCVIALSVSWFAFLPSESVLGWIIATFFTRMGASFVEAPSESYFFKHTQSTNADKISLFRMARPLSSIIGTLIGGIALFYMPFNFLFILIALLMIPGIFFTLLLIDTK